MKEKIVIIGDGEFAEISYEYFTHDSSYEIVAFAVEKNYIRKTSLFDLPIVPLESLVEKYPPNLYKVFVGVTYSKLNRIRKRLYLQCKEWGYTCVSYVSSRAFVWHNVKIGENCFIFEDNTIQYHVKIGDNTILWSGNHIGHRTTIGNHCWLASHIVVSGYCKISDGCFIGVNATFGDNVIIAEDIVFGAGGLTVKNLENKGGVYVGNPVKQLTDRTAYIQFGVGEDEI